MQINALSSTTCQGVSGRVRKQGIIHGSDSSGFPSPGWLFDLHSVFTSPVFISHPFFITVYFPCIGSLYQMICSMKQPCFWLVFSLVKNFVMSLGMLFIDTNMYNNLEGSSGFAVKNKPASSTDFLPKEHFSWSQEKEKGSNIWHRRGDDEIRELLNLYNNGCNMTCCLKSAVLHRDSNRYSM